MHLLPRLAIFALLAGCASNAPAPAAPAAPSAPPAAAQAPRSPAAFHVEVSGHGPPMILVPGLSSSGGTWTATVEHLRDRYTCHVLTLAGFAGVPPVPPPLIPTVKAALVQYITEQKLDRPVIVGHSLGGVLALDVAAERPDLVGPLVIVDSVPFLGIMVGATTVEDVRPIADQIRAGIAGQTQAQYEAFVRSGTATRSMVASPADHERIVGWGLRSERATVTDAFTSLLTTDLRPRLGRITSPALVIGTWIGLRNRGADRNSTVKTFHDQYAGLPRMHFALTDTAHHFVMFDDFPWFIAQLDGFLADPDAAVRDRGFPKE
jgi:pimeloyl-ACP methyl ester carboxylesterase